MKFTQPIREVSTIRLLTELCQLGPPPKARPNKYMTAGGILNPKTRFIVAHIARILVCSFESIHDRHVFGYYAVLRCIEDEGCYCGISKMTLICAYPPRLWMGTAHNLDTMRENNKIAGEGRKYSKYFVVSLHSEFVSLENVCNWG
jgi:hypothetical protein